MLFNYKINNIRMIKQLLNISDRENRAFAFGMMFGSFATLFPLIMSINLSKNAEWFVNNLYLMKRTKLLNGGLNTYYFDSEINLNSIDSFKEFINNLEGTEPIYIYFSTNGGSFSVVQMICDIILSYKGETNGIVLNKSFSAGTLALLCCSNIYMHQNAHLSPVDVMMCSFFDTKQLSSIKTVLNNKSPDKINDDTFILSDQAIKCKNVLDRIYEQISSKHNFNEQTKKNIWDNIFSGEKYTHSTTFSVDVLKSFGLEIYPMDKQMIKLAKLAKTPPN